MNNNGRNFRQRQNRPMFEIFDEHVEELRRQQARPRHNDVGLRTIARQEHKSMGDLFDEIRNERLNNEFVRVNARDFEAIIHNANECEEQKRINKKLQTTFLEVSAGLYDVKQRIRTIMLNREASMNEFIHLMGELDDLLKKL